MRLAIISDVHSNIHALEAVKTEIERWNAELVLCAGDVVGYCAFPNECCEAVRERASRVVIGNHDYASLTRDPSGMNPYAAKAILWTAGVLNKESRQFLGTLESNARLTLGGKKLALFHGSPRSMNEYILEEDVDDELAESANSDILILGHTHVPFVKKFEKGLLVNPGAVGQPRDGDPRASFAILDTDTGECTIKRVGYDVDAAADAIRSAGLPALLADRLFYGT